MEESTVQKATLFVGSSSEAVQQGIAHELEQRLEEDFNVQLWTTSSSVGSYTLDSLLKQAEVADAAIFLFCKDDAREHRGSVGQVARDNVVFEYGLFTALLGRDRVAVIEESGVELPSDIRGVLNHVINLNTNGKKEVSLRRAVDDIRARWGHLMPHGDTLAVRLRLARTLSAEQKRGAELAQQLSKRQDGDDGTIMAIEIDSASGCVAAYAEALTNVQRRFWTTTFFSSGFWTRSEDDIVGANRAMMARLRNDKGEARRLFLLNRKPADEIQSARDKRLRLRHYREESRIQGLDREFKMLCERMKVIQAEGCEVRVVFDDSDSYEDLPRAFHWDPADSELAIYDNFRVDVFDGGSVGRILGVRSYDASRSYVLESVSWYFNKLWDKANPVDKFLAGMRAAVESVAQHIDYEPNWLAAYESYLSPYDKILKASEFDFVERLLKTGGRWGTVRRLLDIGTCTARYPLGLRDALVKDVGEVIGIDADLDCVRFAENNVALVGADRIVIRQRDFLASDLDIPGTFDLVTCMLGTVSHFGYDTTQDCPSELLPRALRRMRSLLAPGGLLLVGAWSDTAIRKEGEGLLSIYSKEDRKRLASWSPSTQVLTEQFDNARLAIVDHHPVDPRLNVWVLEPHAIVDPAERPE